MSHEIPGDLQQLYNYELGEAAASGAVTGKQKPTVIMRLIDRIAHLEAELRETKQQIEQESVDSTDYINHNNFGLNDRISMEKQAMAQRAVVLQRYNVVPRVVGTDPNFVEQAADNGRFLFADSALERIRELKTELREARQENQQFRERVERQHQENMALEVTVARLRERVRVLSAPASDGEIHDFYSAESEAGISFDFLRRFQTFIAARLKESKNDGKD